ncbi:MAG: cobalt-precorrin-5B (C(1))-methyltransferase, partial [Oscillospiraceae bacterium]|nr:cobalt-precorrin-5B (C(1))-methyltransferase [Oscillospiraceae bacterium]
VDTIRVALRQRRESGADYVLLTPGNYGSDFIRDGLGVDPNVAVQTSNFIGDTLEICKDLGFRGALLVGHIGKLVKLAGGMFNTHSKYGDCRMEILAAYAAASGLEAEKTGEILQCVSCDDALRILRDDGKERETLDRLMERIGFHLQAKAGDGMEIGAITFSKVYGQLGTTAGAADLISKIIG